MKDQNMKDQNMKDVNETKTELQYKSADPKFYQELENIGGDDPVRMLIDVAKLAEKHGG